MQRTKDAVSELGEDLDAGWDDLDSVASARSDASAGELDALDDGWDIDDAGALVRVPSGGGVRGGAGFRRPLTKKQRRDLERRLRAEAAQRTSERKAERKQQRREQARQSAEQRVAERRAQDKRTHDARKPAPVKPRPVRAKKAEPARSIRVDAAPAHVEAAPESMVRVRAKPSRRISSVIWVVAGLVLAALSAFFWLRTA